MNHFRAFVLCLAGFAALAFAMHRHQREIIGGSLPLTLTRALRIVGTCAPLFALGVLVTACGWGLGLVIFSGHTSIAADTVCSVLIVYTAIHTRRLQRR
ncbi:DUF3325 domain-containing protein [Tardiphaga sp. 839_C3_N1_4]|jgi:hypothetical protein|uniref:DUF3325 domain-containing protein n=1 Tax=Tardiphaga sp. 839_C3_N1_4 TaxID=3240761 RepID=UPI003F2182F3